jgi:hypothetical protein
MFFDRERSAPAISATPPGGQSQTDVLILSANILGGNLTDNTGQSTPLQRENPALASVLAENSPGNVLYGAICLHTNRHAGHTPFLSESCKNFKLHPG